MSELAQSVSGAELSDLKPKAFQVILGQALARQLRVHIGDKVALLCARREHDAGGTDSPHEAAHGRGLLFKRALRIRFDFMPWSILRMQLHSIVRAVLRDCASRRRTWTVRRRLRPSSCRCFHPDFMRRTGLGKTARGSQPCRSKTHDGDHPLSYCFGRRFRARFHIGDDREGKAV